MSADTSIALTPSAAGVSGPQTVVASAPLFTPDDVGRQIAIRQIAPARQASTAYPAGTIFYSTYNGVDRVYRVIASGTSSDPNLAGTVPNYDLNAARETGDNVQDGTCSLKYLGPGKQAWGFGVIVGIASSTSVTVQVDPRGPFANTNSSLRWRLGEWSPARGYPRAVSFYQQRTVWAGSIVKPQTIWFSETGDYESMTPTEPDGSVLDTNAITITVDDDQVNTIRWLSAVPRGLAAGSPSGEFLVQPASTTNGVIAPNNVRAPRQGDRGSSDLIAGTRVGGAVLFAQQGGRKLRELVYDFTSDSFSTVDLSQLADHIAGHSFVDMAYQASPDGTLWLVRDDGVLVSLTYDREQKVRAWARHIIAGTQAGPARVESVCCVPDPGGTATDVYITVARTIRGAVSRTVEYIRPPFRADLDGDTGGFFVDAGLTYIGPASNSFAGLDHLEGETVAICADGASRPDAVVRNGRVSMPGTAAGTVHIGLACPARMQTLPPEGQAAQGSVMGKPKRIRESILRFSETRGGMLGRDGAAMEPLQMRPQGAAMSRAIPLFSGDYRLTFPAGVNETGTIDLIQTQPLPMTLLAIVADLDTNA